MKLTKSVNLIHHSTEEARMLKEALEKQGISVQEEVYDGHKHIDLSIPEARLDIEVDGLQHLIDPNQIVKDLKRGYYSHRDGFRTMHIPNIMLRNHFERITSAIAEASKSEKERFQLRIHVHSGTG